MEQIQEIFLRMGIFIVLSQTVLQFSCNQTYEKYIRFLTNLMLLSMLAVPLLGLFQTKLPAYFAERTAYYQKELEMREKDMEKEQEEKNQFLLEELVQNTAESEMKTVLSEHLAKMGIEMEIRKMTYQEKNQKWCIEVRQKGKKEEESVTVKKVQDACRVLFQMEESQLEVLISG